MLRLLGDTRFDFMARRRGFYVFSAVVILAGLGSFIAHGGFRLGIDFAGGRLIEFRLSQALDVSEVRDAVGAAGFENAEIQAIAGTNDVLIRIPDIVEQRGGEASPSSLVRGALQAHTPGLEA